MKELILLPAPDCHSSRRQHQRGSKTVKARRRRVQGPREIDDHGPPAGPENTAYLGQRVLDRTEIAEYVSREDAIERPVGERKVLSRANDSEPDRAEIEHSLLRVEGNYFPGAEDRCCSAGARTQIEHTALREMGCASTSPLLFLPERQDPVQEVVACGDSAEVGAQDLSCPKDRSRYRVAALRAR